MDSCFKQRIVLRAEFCSGSSALSKKGRCSSGFTLVEMLAAIGIIVLLGTLMMPAVQKMRIKGEAAEDISRIKNYGSALQLMYGDRSPISAYDIVRSGGSTAVDAYCGSVKSSQKLLNSLAWTRLTKPIAASKGRAIDGTTRSYTLNSTVFPKMAPTAEYPNPQSWELDPAAPIKLQQTMDRPLLFTGVYNPGHAGAYVWGTLFHTNPIYSELVKPVVGADILGKTVVLFVGGHVRMVDFSSENLPTTGTGSDPQKWWVQVQ